MMLKIWKQVIAGIAWGAIVTFVALTALVIFDIESSVKTIWLYMGGSLFIGVYFGLAAFIFIVEHWSPLKKTIIHFFLSITVYFIIAFPLGWVELIASRIIFATLLFIGVYIIFWTGFNLYYRKLAASLNDTLDKKKK